MEVDREYLEKIYEHVKYSYKAVNEFDWEVAMDDLYEAIMLFKQIFGDAE